MLLLRKTLGTFVDFPGIAIVLFLLGALWAKRRQRPKGAYLLCALILYFSSAGWILDLLSPELSCPPPSVPPEAIVVLGGGVERNPETHELTLNPVSLSRVYRAFLLYQERRLPILVSGGKVSEDQERTEAEVAWRTLTTFGVPSKDIILEARSRTTWENARYSAAILRSLGIRSFYLVTSEVHLSRALLAFRKWYPESDIIPCPAHSLKATTLSSLERFLPKREVLCAFGNVVHEGIGYLAYLLKSWFPLSE
ncbi:MAG: YdcF family protein [Candidatus Caldatribacterium sp.]|uniref:YdcF family protein n=1 Tax=Candidatus Caldatribacterium sp. TaxID=2282143 RepID=UPI002990DD4E|nr:YdcF family protein [Candidatus Caldatribacterium sp.]MCX7729860.1 YdcF family protein [Candidatus Caldatribacterium sp.]MDW8082057.1 YdcF family protein [Candidatus Calescibacterium sp.]